MTTSSSLEVRALDLFGQAVELDQELREGWVLEQCGDDLVLKDRVLMLLGADAAAGSDLKTGAGWQPEAFLQTPERIGPYTIEEAIGEGGMATVYSGHRDIGGQRQKVAVKVNHVWRGSAEMMRRFESERNILASLNHPYIAHFHDSGATDSGQLYQVMEWIDGQPIDKYCDDNALSLTDKLSLIERVGTAIQAAHKNLIIHRDIKPSNILVTEDGIPKLIDFGIAKQIDDEHRTQADQLAYTPAYASPEQMRGDVLTTATDVYSLGVVLFRTVVGRKPYNLEELSWHDAHQIVSTQNRLSFDNSVDRDLGAVINKAMHPDQHYRYGSVLELLADLQNMRQHRPVDARTSNWRYRFVKYFRRNMAAVIASISILLAVSIALAVSLVQTENAKAQLVRAQTVTRFLQDLIVAPSPSYAASYQLSPDATYADVLVQAEHQVVADTNLPSDVRIELLNSVAHALMWMDKDDDAVRVQEHAYELASTHAQPNSDLWVLTYGYMGEVYANAGRFTEALPIFDEVADTIEQNGGIQSETQIAIVSNYGHTLGLVNEWQASFDVLKPLVTVYGRIGQAWPESHIATLKNIGIAEFEMGEVSQARQTLHSALDLHNAAASNPHNRFKVLVALGWLEAQSGAKDAALKFFEEAASMDGINFIYGAEEQAVPALHAMRIVIELGRIDEGGEAILAIEEEVAEMLHWPDAWPFHYSKTAYFIALGEYDDALRTAERALRLAKELPAKRSEFAAIQRDIDLAKSRL